MPADQALEELTHLALQGHLTDMERWIDVQSASGDSAPFFAALRDLLERFDFSAIQQLTSHRRWQYREWPGCGLIRRGCEAALQAV